MKRIGVDTGGTFTDVVAVTESGEIRLRKLLSTPDDPGRALRDGVAVVSGRERDRLVHGTTVATNALLERRGARIGFITTKGFESILHLGRQARPELYDLFVRAPEPLVGRQDVFGVTQRMNHLGDIERELDVDELGRLSRWVEENAFEAVAICFLHSYANPDHEVAVEEKLRSEHPALHLSRSSALMPEFREFERASTTTLNAYVGPSMSRYLRRVGDELELDEIEIFLSSGGRAGLAESADEPVHTVLSGPAGGVVGAIAAAREVGIEQIISFDMGGTSTDVSVADGEFNVTRSAEIGGVPIGVPVVEIETVGAGGGSIAWRDPGGALRVGPRSAGADPGPACYGLGGTEPTVTDAHLFLGRLRADRFLGGEMTLDVAAARAAIEGLAAELELPPAEVARGILDVADAAMVRAIKVVSLERGKDPRNYTLVSFGGAGGLHATRLADALEISQVIVPNQPGLVSAWGMLHAPRQWTGSRSVMANLLDRRPLTIAMEELCRLAQDRLPEAKIRLTAAVRYVGQSFEIDVPVARDEWSIDTLVDAFEQEHQELYGYRATRDVECTAVRIDARVEVDPLPRSIMKPTTGETLNVRVTFARGEAYATVYERSDLAEDREISGPAVITEMSGTTVLPQGWSARVVNGHLLLRREER